MNDLCILSSQEHEAAKRTLVKLILQNPRFGTPLYDKLEGLTRAIQAYEDNIALEGPDSDSTESATVGILQRQVQDVCRRSWSKLWSDSTIRHPWADRGVSPEIVEAAESGWLRKGGRILDVGCGLGEVTEWLAIMGYRSVGIDFPEAISQAIARNTGSNPHLDQSSPLVDANPKFIALDICDNVVPPLQFDGIIDRGCLHSIPSFLIPQYAKNLSSMTSSGARMLLFVKAFRGGTQFEDPGEVKNILEWIESIFSGSFSMERHASTYLNSKGILDPQNPLPGMVFWLKKL